MLRLFHHDVHRDEVDGDVRFRLTFGANPERGTLAAQLIAQGCYSLVAEWDRDDSRQALNDFYRLTQNLDSSWSREPQQGVKVVGEPTKVFRGQHYGKRSSMIGDVIEVAERAGDGWRPIKRYVVDMIGFCEAPILDDGQNGEKADA